MITILVTGGLGFIGSNFIRKILSERDDVRIVNLDLETYAGNPDSLADVKEHYGADGRYVCQTGDVRDGELVEALLGIHSVDYLVHFAAESHVDRSIHGGAMDFAATNYIGTVTLLEALRTYGKIKRAIFISTDEVYGALPLEGTERFTESTPLHPHSPYSATKAAGDMMVSVYHEVYGLPVVTTRCSNNYGPYQYPEKLIPSFIIKAMNDEQVPVYGDGLYTRDWIHVDDHNSAVITLLFDERVTLGEAYNIGGDNEWKNIDLTKLILDILGKPHDLMKFVTDRPAHDRRYAIDHSKLTRLTGWMPRVPFEEALRATIEWYRNNPEWVESARARTEKINSHIT